LKLISLKCNLLVLKIDSSFISNAMMKCMHVNLNFKNLGCYMKVPESIKIRKQEIFCLPEIKYQKEDCVGKSQKSSKNA
jgi:hypothetical protein